MPNDKLDGNKVVCAEELPGCINRARKIKDKNGPDDFSITFLLNMHE